MPDRHGVQVTRRRRESAVVVPSHSCHELLGPTAGRRLLAECRGESRHTATAASKPMTGEGNDVDSGAVAQLPAGVVAPEVIPPVGSRAGYRMRGDATVSGMFTMREGRSVACLASCPERLRPSMRPRSWRARRPVARPPRCTGDDPFRRPPQRRQAGRCRKGPTRPRRSATRNELTVGVARGVPPPAAPPGRSSILYATCVERLVTVRPRAGRMLSPPQAVPSTRRQGMPAARRDGRDRCAVTAPA